MKFVSFLNGLTLSLTMMNSALGDTCNFFLDEDGWATPINVCVFADSSVNGTSSNESYIFTCDSNNNINEIYYSNNDCSGIITSNVTYASDEPSYQINTCASGGITDCDLDVRYFYWCEIDDGSACSADLGCYYWPNYDIECSVLESSLASWTDEEWYGHNATWGNVECLEDGSYAWEEYANRSCDSPVEYTYASCSNPDTPQCEYMGFETTEMDDMSETTGMGNNDGEDDGAMNVFKSSIITLFMVNIAFILY